MFGIGKRYYHVTAVENVESILAEGLKGSTTPRNRGNTFDMPSICVLTFRFVKLTDSIAIRQIWPCQDIEKYALIRVSSAGITGRVVEDNVAEFTAPWHRVIEQECIEPQYLKHVKTRVLNFPGETVSQLLQDQQRKMRWTPSEWAIAEKYLPPENLAQRRIFEAQQDQRKLTAEEWKKVRRFVHPSVVEDQQAFESQLDRKKTEKVKKPTSKRIRGGRRPGGNANADYSGNGDGVVG